MIKTVDMLWQYGMQQIICKKKKKKLKLLCLLFVVLLSSVILFGQNQSEEGLSAVDHACVHTAHTVPVALC